MALEIGQEAPDFTLVNEDNEQVTLSELRGAPVVLVFYTFDFSGICTNELCEIRDDYSSWADAGATVFGISRDSRLLARRFKASENLSHSLLADLKGEVAQAYGTWNEALGAAERLTVVVGADGNIAYSKQTRSPEARDHSDVLAAIQGS